MEKQWLVGFEQGAKRWPAIGLCAEDFFSHLESLDLPLESPIRPDELFLCAACSLGSDRACRDLEAQYFPAIRRLIGQIESRADLGNEVLQLLRLQLFSGSAPKIATYTGRGPLQGWLRIVAKRIALRQKQTYARAIANTLDLSVVPQAELGGDSKSEDGFLEPHYARLVESVLADVFRGLKSENRAVLRLHFSQGLNIEAIGRIYGVHRATVARWIASHREQLMRGVRLGLQEKLGPLAAGEFEGLLSMVYDQLDVSVTALLRKTVPVGKVTCSEN